MKGGARKGAGRPALPHKKLQVNVKLPPWLIAWMDARPESRAVLIEQSCRAHYKIKDGEDGA